MKEINNKNLILTRIKKNSISFLWGLYSVILNVFPVALITMAVMGFKLVEKLNGYRACLTFLAATVLILIALNVIVVLGKFYKASRNKTKSMPKADVK